MKIYFFDGPKDGATYLLIGSGPEKSRPDGIWFTRKDTKGRTIRDEYRKAGRIHETDRGMSGYRYEYDGETVESTSNQ